MSYTTHIEPFIICCAMRTIRSYPANIEPIIISGAMKVILKYTTCHGSSIICCSTKKSKRKLWMKCISMCNQDLLKDNENIIIFLILVSNVIHNTHWALLYLLCNNNDDVIQSKHSAHYHLMSKERHEKIYNMPCVLYNLLLNEKIWTKRVREMRFIVKSRPLRR